MHDVERPIARIAGRQDNVIAREQLHRLVFHNNPKRGQVLLAHGVPTLRVTDRHLTSEPVVLIARIAQALRA